jgi:hypothetical protein
VNKIFWVISVIVLAGIVILDSVRINALQDLVLSQQSLIETQNKVLMAYADIHADLALKALNIELFQSEVIRQIENGR